MKNRRGIIYFLQETLIVVIGVLIAVSIGDYKEQQDNQRYIEKTLLAIENEIKFSQADLDSILIRHIELFEEVQADFGEDTLSLGELVAGAGGFQVASIKNISLRFFVSNKAELIDFKIITQLLEIEQKSELLAQKIKMLTEFAYEHVNETDEEIKIKFTYLLANVIDGEQTLSEAYRDFLSENEKYLE